MGEPKVQVYAVSRTLDMVKMRPLGDCLRDDAKAASSKWSWPTEKWFHTEAEAILYVIDRAKAEMDRAAKELKRTENRLARVRKKFLQPEKQRAAKLTVSLGGVE